jgi:hypothetical protein
MAQGIGPGFKPQHCRKKKSALYLILQMRLKRGKQFFYITKLIHNGTGI